MYSIQNHEKYGGYSSEMQKSLGFRHSAGGAVLPDMAGLMARKNKILASQRAGIDGLLKGRKVNVIKGCARITGPGALEVTAEEDTTVSLSWDKLIIAVGTRPMNVPDFAFDGKKFCLPMIFWCWIMCRNP